jgi:hypothetical protein
LVCYRTDPGRNASLATPDWKMEGIIYEDQIGLSGNVEI